MGMTSTIGRLLQAHKSEKDQRLLDASKRFDSAFSRYDMSVFNGLLHEDVVLHKVRTSLSFFPSFLLPSFLLPSFLLPSSSFVPSPVRQGFVLHTCVHWLIQRLPMTPCKCIAFFSPGQADPARGHPRH